MMLKKITPGLAIGLMFLMVTANARADPPACASPVAKQGLETSAKEAIEFLRQFIKGPEQQAAYDQLFPSGSFEVKLTSMYGVPRSDAINDCQATIVLSSRDRKDGSAPVEYTVVRTEDGNTLYQQKLTRAATVLDDYVFVNGLQEARLTIVREATVSKESAGIRAYQQAHPEMNRSNANGYDGFRTHTRRRHSAPPPREEDEH